MPSPPEIIKPFANSTERATARATFLRLGGLLEEVMTAESAGPLPTWLTAELSKPLRGFREAPQDRLDRYASSSQRSFKQRQRRSKPSGTIASMTPRYARQATLFSASWRPCLTAESTT